MVGMEAKVVVAPLELTLEAVSATPAMKQKAPAIWVKGDLLSGALVLLSFMLITE